MERSIGVACDLRARPVHCIFRMHARPIVTVHRRMRSHMQHVAKGYVIKTISVLASIAQQSTLRAAMHSHIWPDTHRARQTGQQRNQQSDRCKQEPYQQEKCRIMYTREAMSLSTPGVVWCE